MMKAKSSLTALTLALTLGAFAAARAETPSIAPQTPPAPRQDTTRMPPSQSSQLPRDSDRDAPGQEMKEHGSMPGEPGASGFAPGHEMRDRGSAPSGPGSFDSAPSRNR